MLRRDSLPIDLCQEPAERRATLITAIGEQERKRRGCRAPDEVQEELETRLIAPMEIFNEDEEGPLPGQSHFRMPTFHGRGVAAPARDRG